MLSDNFIPRRIYVSMLQLKKKETSSRISYLTSSKEKILVLLT